jgi:hypothetical protein
MTTDNATKRQTAPWAATAGRKTQQARKGANLDHGDTLTDLLFYCNNFSSIIINRNQSAVPPHAHGQSGLPRVQAIVS